MNASDSATVLPDWLRQRALVAPELPAIEAGGHRLTFGELDERVNATANRLQDEGVSASDRIALLAANGLEFGVTFFAAARLGACLVPLNLRLSDLELAWQLADSQPLCVLTDSPERIELIDASMPKLLLKEMAAASRQAAPPGVEPDPDQPLCIFYTSGTTGRPKGALLSRANFFWSALGSLLQLGHQQDDRWLICLPMFHIGGLSILNRCALNGITSVIHPGFDAHRVNKAVDEEGITMVSVVPTMLQRMLDDRADRPFPSSLRTVLLGGGPISDALTQRCLRLGVPALQTYGLTETCSQLTTLKLAELQNKAGSAGRPILPAELRVERDDGSVCAANEPGEIAVRGPMVTAGYFNRPQDSETALRGGWLHTGDLGYVDADGYLYVIDRRADLIVSGGENVYPAEVETVLELHPAVAEAGCFGRPDDEWGQAVVAAVRLEADKDVGSEDLQGFARTHLAGYKTPKAIFFVENLPRTASGKLQRGELRSSILNRETRG